MAPARSIQCIRRPPSRAPRGLASFGKTISAISDCESRTGRGNAGSRFSFMDLCSRGDSPRRAGFYAPDTIANNILPSSECAHRGEKRSTGREKHRIPEFRGRLDDASIRKRTKTPAAHHDHERWKISPHRTGVPQAAADNRQRTRDYRVPVAPDSSVLRLHNQARSNAQSILHLKADAKDEASRHLPAC